MVGVRASDKCDNCRIRKRKCLGERPACSECIRSGWECPGYKAQWKFVDEAPRMKKYYSTRKVIYEISESEDISDDEPPTKQRGLVWKNIPFGQRPNPKLVRRREQVEVSRFNGFDLLGSTLVYCLSIKSKGALLRLGLVDMYFEFIPSRLGSNPALDESIRCLCAIYSTSNPTPFRLRRDVCQTYVRAIKALRRCLDDPFFCMEPETLCASLLLHIFELVLHGDDKEWDHLACGSARLLYARGVERYKTPFELAMLESQFAFLFRQSAKFREHCFLQGPEWQALARESSHLPFHSKQPLSFTWRTKLCGVMLVHFSSVIIGFEDVCKNASMNKAGWEEQVDQLIDKSYPLMDQVRNWVATEVDPVIVSPKRVGDGNNENHIYYHDLVAGVVDCMAHIAIITTNRMLCALCFVFVGPNGPTLKQIEIRQRLETPDSIQMRLQRAEGAHEFVHGESSMAGKPLEYGLENCRDGVPPR